MQASSFEGAVEVCATTDPGATGRRWIQTAVVACPRQHATAGSTCLRCSRFINVKPSTDHAWATVRCLVTDRDSVGDFMTPAIALAAVEPSTTVYQAYRAAHTAGIHHLLVVDDDRLAGIVCRCQLLPPVVGGERVEHRMATDLWVVDDVASLGQAAAIMRDAGVGLLPVVRDHLVVGVVSRSDLLRVGADSEEIAPSQCPECGSTHRAGAMLATGSREHCLHCFEALLSPEDFEPIE